MGIKSLREFSRATGVARNAITAAEDGHGSEGTYQRLEAWLDRFDEETGQDAPPFQVEQLTFVVEGKGVTVTVKGPIADREALKRDVADLIQQLAPEPPAAP